MDETRAETIARTVALILIAFFALTVGFGVGLKVRDDGYEQMIQDLREEVAELQYGEDR